MRIQGKTYREICDAVSTKIPKGTISGWCKGIELPDSYWGRVKSMSIINVIQAQKKAVVANKLRRAKYLKGLIDLNIQVSKEVKKVEVAKVALAMLCLGEASKSQNGKTFALSNSDPKIIELFLKLLQKCFAFDSTKIRCRVQCRADQDPVELIAFWSSAG